MIKLSDSFREFFDVPDEFNAGQWFCSLQGEKLQMFRQLLNSPEVDIQMVDALQRCYDTYYRDNPDPEARGLIGYLLFSLLSERPGNEAALDAYLKIGEISNFIFTEYKITELEREAILCYHRAGTTSFILRTDSKKIGRTVALKLLKMRYFSNRNITQKTKNYKYLYSSKSDFAPRVYDSTESHIIMDFISGLTLREYVDNNIRQRLKDDKYSREDIDQFKSIIDLICEALKFYNTQKPRIIHLDLSPDNILLEVDPASKAVTRLYLIDFGYNYILAEGIGSLHAHARARVFIAKELGENYGDAGDYRSDLYSLGMILLDLASEVELKPENVYSNLEELWMRFPDFAPIIERMISDEPELRELLPEDQKRDVYEKIEAALQVRLNLIREMQERSRQAGVLTIAANIVSHLLNATLGELLTMFTRLKVIRKVRTEQNPRSLLINDSREKSLLGWASLTYACNILIIALFIGFGRGNLQAVYSAFGIINLSNWYGFWKSMPQFFNAIPVELAGQLVGLSFTALATCYYMNIFSTLYPPVGRGAPPISTVALVTIRMNSFIYSIPIGIAMVAPRYWPLCSAVGVFIVALNNFACNSLVRFAHRSDKVKLNVEQRKFLDNFEEYFAEWGPLMIGYAIALLCVWIFLSYRIVRDEWAYAVIVMVFVNHQKLLQYNSIRCAPKVRAAIERTIFWIRTRMIECAERA